METFGKDNFLELKKQLGKDEKEIKDYHCIFWRRIDELEDKDKIVANIKKDQKRKKKNVLLEHFLKTVFEGNQQALMKNKMNLRSKVFNEKIDLMILKGYYYKKSSSYIQNILIELKKKHIFNYNIRTLTTYDIQRRLKSLKSNLFKE